MPKTRLQAKKEPSKDITTKGFRLALSEKTYVMGVLNVTPDSFSDGGKFFNKDKAIAQGLSMARDGADIIDVGGESTRPGAGDLNIEEEIARTAPVIEGLSKKLKIPISIDTRKSEVAEAAIKAGASMINDVSGLRHDPRLADVAAKYGVAIILMHMKGTPRNMQDNPEYNNLMKEIIDSLKGSIGIAKEAGVAEDKIIVDPGIGFGKGVEHNLEILRSLGELKSLGRPICIGTSRKSFIGKVLNIPNADDRLAGTLATCVMAVTNGADILRVHDVKDCREAAAMVDSVLKSGMS